MKKIFFICLVLFLPVLIIAQTDYLTIDKNIRLPKDSTERNDLITRINDFLFAISRKTENNTYILIEEKSETQIIINEIESLLNEKDNVDIKPFLLSAELFYDRQAYLIQVAYCTSQKGGQSIKGIFDFIAHKTDKGFLISSPLLRNTQDWKTEKEGNLIFHYQDIIAENIISQYIKYITEYDRQLNLNKTTEYYFCDDCESMTQMLQLCGIRYKVDYNGLTWNGISFVTDEKIIFIQSQRQSRQKKIDPHYLYHSQADFATADENKNYYMICAGANVYSGCWGMDWKQIQKMFKDKIGYDKKTDWLKLYYNRCNFGESQQKYIFVTTFINGLLIEKVEKEQGFSAVKSLYASGDMYENKDSFFENLEKVTGINEANFNKKIGKIIEEAMKDV
ncbi:MAG: hypothetical protein E6767_10220 [Dysgonomonas sp.]|nr:hypothetical protein [Dysgonomonas sp.]